jgi:hypothetical protein
VFSTGQTSVGDCHTLVGKESQVGSIPRGGRAELAREPGEIVMLFALAVILLIAWLLGVVGTYTIGTFVHLLLVVAVVLFVVGLLNGRRVLV